MNRTWWSRVAAAVLFVSFATVLTACGEQSAGAGASGEHGADEAESERGPQNGRLLRSGDFAVEITIFETGVPPEFHVYAYKGGKPVAPSTVALTVMLKRLGGKTDTVTFKPDKDYLVSSGPVAEPHSFDVEVAAVHAGKQHKWSFESYEGRTAFSNKAAAQAGVTIEKAGPATIKETIELLGHLELAPGAKAELRARFPGKILSVTKNVGDKVRSGEMLARIESNESLQSYAITAPFDGVVLERAANVGDVTGDGVLFSVGNPSKLMADYHVFDRDAGRVKAGQAVRVVPVHGTAAAGAKIATVAPVKDPVTQTIVARVMFEDSSGSLLPGMSVKGEVVVAQTPVPLAVKTAALQRFRDFEVVFAKFGETYEVRMLEIGRRTVEWTEVLGGIDPGQAYVAGNSFLIKADIEKSGASHDH
ncbi:MAG: HlyD family efflux transporter periplasmic adaptor subunit [Alphaproteobacteria bacterium]|nr:HlyD family efflux transporter periplasmic adaptor subunit [Alphaproteobacteria bacterium]